jgi:glyoxylase-like metal-dependent hydrolase (beta-lactamase superfamily II)
LSHQASKGHFGRESGSPKSLKVHNPALARGQYRQVKLLDVTTPGGQLIGRLKELGVAPDEIEAIVITHTHPDHVGNLSNQDETPAFPKAAVHAPEPDWQFFYVNDPDLSHLPTPRDFRSALCSRKRRRALKQMKAKIFSP